jgi:hypothetical protein
VVAWGGRVVVCLWALLLFVSKATEVCVYARRMSPPPFQRNHTRRLHLRGPPDYSHKKHRPPGAEGGRVRSLLSCSLSAVASHGWIFDLRADLPFPSHLVLASCRAFSGTPRSHCRARRRPCCGGTTSVRSRRCAAPSACPPRQGLAGCSPCHPTSS